MQFTALEDRIEDATSSGVSIIITTYNHARFLADAIESALGQSTAPDEVIVVDDGSTDDPGSVVSRYPQVRLIRQPNQGLAAARNTGWRAARGYYLVFLDADDRLKPNALASNLHRFDERPECAFVYAAFDFVDAEGRHLDSPPLVSVGEDAYASFLKENCVRMHAAVMYRRDYLEEAGGFDERLPCCEDYELYLRLARRYRVAAGAECVAEYRRHGSNMSENSALMLGTVLEVLRRENRYVKNNVEWSRASESGARYWKSVYVEAQVYATLRARASGPRQIPWRATARVLALAPATFLRIAGGRVLKSIRARLTPSRRKSVKFGDLRRLRPISSNFGFDRGKPVDRRYIEDFLSRHAEDIKGRVLEIGDNTYTRQYGEARVTRSDVLHVSAENPAATLVGDLAEGHNLPSAAFDCIVLTQTLHFIYDISKAAATLHRMLKPGGVLLVTVAGVSCIEQEPNWAPLWTLSSTALRRLLGGAFGDDQVCVSAYGNVLAAVAFLHGLAESELRPAELDAHDPQYPVIVAARAVRR
ncbi:MAG: glycosyltransferase [Stellaceae bacterium]